MTTATQIAYLHLCHRKLWLHANHIQMENATDNVHVAEGKLIEETTYNRRAKKWKELKIGSVKIDHYDPATNTIREVKKSNKFEQAHVAQVKYYLYVLEQKGVADTTGIIEYPKQRKTTTVELAATDRNTIANWEAEVAHITSLSRCPDLVQKSYCRSCAFRDFCFI